MSIIEDAKNDLKRILPPPVDSFMREINIVKAELSRQHGELSELREENRKLLDELRGIREDGKKQSGELSELREENRKLLDELRGIREDGKKHSDELSELREENRKLLDELRGIREDSKKQSGELSKLREENRKLLDELKRTERKAAESIWASIFNNTITGSAWLKTQTFSPGRWALGYPALYALYRILNGVKPKHILELGLGQSTNMITQYVSSKREAEHFVVEHDPAWLSFYKKEYPVSKQTEIVQLDRTFVPYKEAESVRVFDGFKERFSGKRFDFILIDAPLGSDMKQYARIDILSLLPECLSESFTILFDDTGRSGETNTIKEICCALDAAEIKYVKGNYSGEKTCTVICSADNAFLCTL